MGRKVSKIIDGRRIWEHDPIDHYVAPWYSVEFRGPLFEGRPIQVFRAFDSLAEAIAEAERRGPIPDHPED